MQNVKCFSEILIELELLLLSYNSIESIDMTFKASTNFSNQGFMEYIFKYLQELRFK